MRHLLLIVAFLGAGLAGCQQMNVQGDQGQDDRVFTTGSHLPSRAGANSGQSVTTLGAPTIDQTMRGQVCGGGGACGASK